MGTAAAGRGLMAEILGGLALLMFAATAVLGVVLTMHHEDRQRALLARWLAAEAPASPSPLHDAAWWEVGPRGEVRARSSSAGRIDPESLSLANEARERDAPLLRMGEASDQVRFARPFGREGWVAAARLPTRSLPGIGGTPRLVALGILAADATIFVAFGASLLRRRLVLPLRRLAAAARAIADGATELRAPVGGARETAEVAVAFNEMTDALATRSDELEKAVADLRRANRELQDVQSHLARADRLAAVGRLAAGVAHEVGNPMGALLAFLDLALRDPSLSSASRGHLERAGAQVERVRKILRQMLDFSRPTLHERVAFDLGAVMDDTAALLRTQAGRRSVAIETRREGRLPLALGDPAAVAQILLNLGLNALDAVDAVEAPCVEFVVRAGSLRRRAGETAEIACARVERDAVECLVIDNGPGIPDADRERIFDPFFTTKPPGKGTGLGASNALRLAEELGGTLALLPGSGGARFLLRLPAAVHEANCEVRTRVRSRGARSRRSHDEESQA